MTARQARKQLLVKEAQLLQAALELELAEAAEDAASLRSRARLVRLGLRLGVRLWRMLRRRRTE
ncbi:MAG: hypothetical protein ACOCVM_02335 [Desulfovibrionaceae bacterium]